MSGSTRPRRRDGIFKKLGWNPSSGPSQPGAAPGSSPPGPAQPNVTSLVVSSLSVVSRPRGGFLSEALDKLEREDRAVIEERHVAANINAVVRAAYDGANELKTKLEDSTGPIGKIVDRILSWIDKFKPIGDAAASLDPIHAGLPWAGIKILLSLAISDISQRKALVIGMELALKVSNRLRAYFLYFEKLSEHLTTQNFRKALVAAYAQLLRFLAKAIRFYNTNTVVRGLSTLWQDTTIQDFERDCEKSSHELAGEAASCEANLADAHRSELRKWRGDLEEKLKELDKIANIQSSIDTIYINSVLSKLPVISSAAFNSSEQQHLTPCLEGTRVDVMKDIMDWSQEPDAKPIYWLCGKAGTGKSTISRTIAKKLEDKKLLGASFMFKRDDAKRGNADGLISTIVAKLCIRFPDLKKPVFQALEDDPEIHTKGLREQFEMILLKPLQTLTPAQLPASYIAVVIDALDECNSMHIEILLNLLADVGSVTNIRLRLFVTSRPDHPILLGFKKINGPLHKDVFLEEAQESSIRDDIRLYLEHEFAEIRDREGIPPSTEWPSLDAIESLVDRSVPLFIFAATVCRFVGKELPQKRLDGIVYHKRTVSSLRLGNEAHLWLIYSQILEQPDQSANSDAEEDRDAIELLKTVIGAIVLAADPLSARSLASILEISIEEVNHVTRKLNAVLNVPQDSSQPIQTLHLSFREFLTSTNTQNKANDRCRINERETHADLASRCIHLLMKEGNLQQDICKVNAPGYKRLELTEEQISQSIPPDIAYACMYWPHHLVASGKTMFDEEGPIHKFLTTHFMHWLEAMSWLGKYSLLISSILQLISITKGTKYSKISLFLEDARRFALKFRNPIELAPLQVYHSALRFAPTKSILSQAFHAEVPDVWDLFPDVDLYWSPDFLVLEAQGHPLSVVFSPDGQLLASALANETVQVWSIVGEQMYCLRLESEVVELHFCFQGTQLALVTFEGQVQFRDVVTGRLLSSFDLLESSEPFDRSTGDYGASISNQGRVAWMAARKIWTCDQHGNQRLVFSGHEQAFVDMTMKQTIIQDSSGSVDESAIPSVDGLDDLSGPDDSSADDSSANKRDRGSTSRRANAPCDAYHAEQEFSLMALSPEGQFAAADFDGRLIFWKDLANAKEQSQTIQLPWKKISGIKFRADGQELVTYRSDPGDGGNICIWACSEAKMRCRWKKQIDQYPLDLNVALSLNGQLAVASDAGIDVWDTHTDAKARHFQETAPIKDVAYSSEGQLASCNMDDLVRLWETALSDDQESWGETPSVHFNARCCKLSSDGDVLASTQWSDPDVWLWDVQTGKPMAVLSGHTHEIDAIACSSYEKVIASASWDRTIRVWSTETARELQCFDVTEPATALAFSHNGEFIAFGNGYGEVSVVDIKTGKTIYQDFIDENMIDDEVIALAASPDDSLVVSSHESGRLRIRNISTGEILQLSAKGPPYFMDIAVNCEKRIAATSRPWPVQIWDAGSEQSMLKLFGDDNARHPSLVKFSADGQFLHTNAGTFDLTHLSGGSPPSFQPPLLRLNKAGDWIQCYGVDMLWLPPEYRNDSMARDFVHGRTLGVPTVDKAVIFFRLIT